MRIKIEIEFLQFAQKYMFMEKLCYSTIYMYVFSVFKSLFNLIFVFVNFHNYQCKEKRTSAAVQIYFYYT